MHNHDDDGLGLIILMEKSRARVENSNALNRIYCPKADCSVLYPHTQIICTQNLNGKKETENKIKNNDNDVVNIEMDRRPKSQHQLSANNNGDDCDHFYFTPNHLRCERFCVRIIVHEFFVEASFV